MTKLRNWLKGRSTEKVEKKNLQKYQEQLAQTLTEFEQFGERGKRLAEVFLQEEKLSEDYLSSMKEGEKLPKEMADKLINDYKFELLVKYLDKFEGVDYQKLVERLIESRYPANIVGDNLDKFQGIDYQKIVDILIDKGRDWRNVSKILEKYEKFSPKTVDSLLQGRKGDIVVKYLDKFEGINSSNIANKFIEYGGGYDLLKNLDKFEGLDYQEVANKLIEKGWGGVLLENLDKFKGINHQEIVNLLIEKEQGRVVAANLNKFEGVNSQEVGKLLISKGYEESVLENWDKFEGLNSQEIKEILYERGEFKLLMCYANLFEGLNHQEIVENVIKTGKDGFTIAYHLPRLRGLNAKIAEYLCSHHYCEYVAKNIDSFISLNERVAELLIRAGEKDVVLQHPEKFGLKKEK